MAHQNDLVGYDRAQANEYETVYMKPERQVDLSELHAIVPESFAGRHVLEVACGTGYRTRRLAARAMAVTACDLVPEVLEIARATQPATAPADFVLADAFALDGVPGAFDAAFVGFLWSHIRHTDLSRFVTGLHRRQPGRSRVLIADNRYVAGSNSAITRTDSDGNTYQRRILDNGSEYEVLKNFPSPVDVRDVIHAVGAVDLAIVQLAYYWYASYETH